MRTITLEEHFATPEFFDGPARFATIAVLLPLASFDLCS
jgi:hypothetical protein